LRLFSKLLLLALAPALLTAGALVGLFWYGSEPVLRAQLERIGLDVLALETQRLSQAVTTVSGELRVAAALPEFHHGDLDEIRRRLKQLQRGFPRIIEKLYYNTADGTVYDADGTTFSVRDRPYFAQIERGETVVTPVLDSRDTGNPIVLVLRPMFDESGKRVGALGATIRAEALARIFESMALGEGGFGVLLDPEGTVVSKEDLLEATGVPAALSSGPEKDPALEHLLAAMKSGEEGQIALRWHGAAHTAFYSRIPATQWQLALVFPDAQLFAARKDLGRLSLLVLVLTVVTGVVASLGMRQLFVRPLLALQRAHARVSSGDLSARAALLSSDELGELAVSFNGMAARLEEDQGRIAAEWASRQAAEAEALAARARLQGIIDSATEVSIIAADTSGIITVFNAGAERLLGYEAAEMVGKQTPEIIHLADEVEAHASVLSVLYGEPISGFETFVAAARRGTFDAREWTYVRKDGTRLTVNLVVTAIRDGNGEPTGFLGVASDISQRKRMELQREGEQQVLELMARGTSLKEVLANLALQYERLFPDALCSVLLLDVDGKRLRHGTGPSLPDSYIAAVDGVEIGPMVGSCGTACFRREMVLVEDIAVDPLWENFRDIALSHGLRACWSVPIFSPEGAVLGTFATYYRAPRAASAAEIGAIQRASGLASLAIVKQRTREALEASESLFRGYFELGLIGMAITSLEKGWLRINERMCAMLGYSREELWAMTWAELTHPDDLAADVAQFERVLAGEMDGYSMDKRFIRKSGAVVHTAMSVRCVRDVDGAPLHFLAMILDISERKASENEVRRSRDLLAQTGRLARLGGWEYDLRSEAMRWTEESYRIFDVAPGKVVSLAEFLAFCPDSERGTLEGAVRDAMRSGASWDLELPAITATGRAIWVRNVGAVELEDGISARLRGVFQDITERKQSEAERAKLEEQLRQSQRMDAIGQLAGGIAHDFNNLLQVILGHLELVQQELPGDSTVAAQIGEVRAAATRAAELTRQLLTFSRRQVIQPTGLELNHLVGDMLKMLRRLIGEHIEICFRPCGGALTILADKSAVEQAIMNLCVNARDAMPGGGVLTIETGETVVDESLMAEHPWAEAGRYALLTVSDTGIGMDAETLRQIFEPFFTTKDVGEGTGLGLATVHGIVRQHKGLIHVYSEPGQGTVFRV